MAKKDKPSNAIGCLAALVIAIIVVIVVVIVNLFNGDDDKKEEKDDKVTVSKDASPKEKLAANIKNNIGKEHFKSISLKEDEDKIIIYLKNYDGVTEKGQIKNMDNGIVKSLMQLKKSDINVNNIEVTVMQDVQTKKLKDAEAVKLRTTWDPETVSNLNKDNEGDVFNNAKDYAKEYNLNENIK